jgi:hypothetical protein
MNQPNYPDDPIPGLREWLAEPRWPQPEVSAKRSGMSTLGRIRSLIWVDQSLTKVFVVLIRPITDIASERPNEAFHGV